MMKNLFAIFFMFCSVVYVNKANAAQLIAGKAPSAIYDIRDYGAKGDALTVNTQAIQTAINKCNNNGGGVVLIAGGQYVTGTIFNQEYKARIGALVSQVC
jgi:polygalacturonase